MDRAIEISKGGIGSVSPNPLVGCVLVKNGEIIGEGYHEKYGDPHAEVMAYNNSIEDPLDSTMYVTLEPCSFEGKTPACTKFIIENGIREVYVSMKDPNPKVSGMGIEELEKHGVQVNVGILQKEYGYKVDIIPLEVIVRNKAAGTFCKRYGLEVGASLKIPIVEFCVKNDNLNDPPICEDAIVSLNITDTVTLSHIKLTSLKINEILQNTFKKCGLQLIDFKLEFGLDKEGKILLADEICPDTMRLWNDKNESFDKDLFRNDSGDLLAGYRKVQELLINTL